ncbi:MAG: ABC transporter permease, partial [Bacteroidetes bacterium]|nr:ABC transporter permease [Fibrella sp.]
MLPHNLRLAYRNIKRFKSTFFINLVGLSTGLACALLIYLWVHDEWRMDKFHEQDSRLVQVVQNINLGDGGVLTEESTPALLGKAIQQELPQIDDVALTTSGKGVLSVSNTRLKVEGLYVTPNFLTLFTYPLVEGSKQ